MSLIDIFRGSNKKQAQDPETQSFDPAKALIRIAVFTSVAGAVVISFGAFTADQAKQIGVGLITAGGAAVVGALLGFIFGVPFSRDTQSGNQVDSDNKSKDVRADTPRYKPNTSLEQISEWLSKMLVGVGLVELKSISKELYNLARFISSGLGNSDAATVFAYFAVLLFAGCGFLFGFIWARIYLRRWFTKADEDLAKKLDDKLSRIESESRALILATQQLQPSEEERSASVEELTDVFKKASRTTKADIFDRARQASESDRGAPEHEARNEGAIRVFRALIADDPKGYYHRTRAELAYALIRRRHSDPNEVIDAMSDAIRLRDDHNVSGWKSHELRRARFRIQQDKEFNTGQVTNSPLKDEILDDLRAAKKDSKWQGWIESESYRPVKEWLMRNEPSFL